MDLTQLETFERVSSSRATHAETQDCISLETEMPEPLYTGMKDFIRKNPNWDQYKLMSSALANFLFQNGCEDRVVTEKYLDDIFNLSNA
tara:strand:- start:361 stop:627 length:267 start_codon:yes stop_codon:yes gene_type:complete